MSSRITTQAPNPSNLADVLDRVLDKGIVIAGDVAISLVGVELLTIRLRLLISSVDKAREIGISWWDNDPYLAGDQRALEQENKMLRDRLEQLEKRLGLEPPKEEPAAIPLPNAAPAGAEKDEALVPSFLDGSAEKLADKD